MKKDSSKKENKKNFVGKKALGGGKRGMLKRQVGRHQKERRALSHSMYNVLVSHATASITLLLC
jgi:hypothetical protein